MKQGFRFLTLMMLLAMLLSACNLSTSTNAQVSQDLINTAAAGTVSAQLTQISIQTLAALLTQQAIGTPTPEPTFTPSPTETPTMTLTPQFTYTPTFTFTPVIPTSTATNTPLPIPCNQATFITDVTIPDKTQMVAGQSFVKTWRVKNAGTCEWTTAYSIYFLSGNAMSAPASVAFTKTVKPGETVDLSVSMTAPSTAGEYTGTWMIKGTNNSAFGVGTAPGVPLTVVIKVNSIPTPKDVNIIYDFVTNYCSGQWRTNAGNISCPTASYDYSNGTISRTYAPVLESGSVDDEAAIITIPSKGGDGFIQGQFPKLLIHSGDRFKAALTCTANKTRCSVIYELLAQEFGTDTVTSLGTWTKTYSSSVTQANVDLSAYDGKEMIFYLKVTSQGDSTDDFAQWIAARITHP